MLRKRSVAIAILSGLALVATLLTPGAIGAQGTGLGDLAPDRLAVGGVLHSYDSSWDDGLYAQTAVDEFDAITATAYMPWGPHPTQDRIDTEPLDRIVSWANQNDLRVHGHVLLYPAVNENLDWYANLDGGHRDILENYVRTIAESNAGDIWVWDVVNELFADPGEQSDDRGLRTSYVEDGALGGTYDDVFRWARESDPDATLILNDYGAETINAKSDAILAEAIAMRERGVPIDGIGFQMHLGADPDFWGIRQNLQRFADAGFELYITELDVSIVERASGDDPLTSDERRRQREIYEEVTRVALEQPAMESLLFWDFADERSWLHPTRQPLGPIPTGTYSYPAVFREPAIGEPLQPKAAYLGVVEALEDFADRPFTRDGLRRLQGVGGPDVVYLGRAASDPQGQVAGDDTWLGRLTAEREDFLSLQWEIEPVENGWFRIRSAWEGNDGYLTRIGIPGADGFIPTEQVGFEPLNASWPSQLWRIENLDAPFRFRLVNLWEPHTGVLTRTADNVVVQAPGAPWGPQRWRVRNVE